MGIIAASLTGFGALFSIINKYLIKDQLSLQTSNLKADMAAQVNGVKLDLANRDLVQAQALGNLSARVTLVEASVGQQGSEISKLREVRHDGNGELQRAMGAAFFAKEVADTMGAAVAAALSDHKKKEAA